MPIHVDWEGLARAYRDELDRMKELLIQARLNGRYAKLEGALHKIERMPDEDNEWDGKDKFRKARDIAKAALASDAADVSGDGQSARE